MSAKVFLIDEYVTRENESGSDDIIDFNPFEDELFQGELHFLVK